MDFFNFMEIAVCVRTRHKVEEEPRKNRFHILLAILCCIVLCYYYDKKISQKNSGTPFSGNEKFKYKLVEYNYDAPNFQ